MDERPVTTCGLVTKVVRNCPLRECRVAVIYSHGFPDVAVDPYNHAGVESRPPFASRTPCKWSRSLLEKIPQCAFIGFNTSGVCGSDRPAHERQQGETKMESYDQRTVAPPSFYDKTLTRDLDDLGVVVADVRTQCPTAKIVLCGLSTGAVLSMVWPAFNARRQLPGKHPCVDGIFVQACVSDFNDPSVDFSAAQMDECNTKVSVVTTSFQPC